MASARLALLLVCLTGCATPLSREGRKDLERNTIHAHHGTCMAAAERYGWTHGVDALRFFQCDANSEAECRAAGLEHNADQWQGGGL